MRSIDVDRTVPLSLTRRYAVALVVLAAIAASPTASALPPGVAARGFVEGANHHLGDASFVARFGRPPGPGDSEALRMHVHLAFVREWLASRPATRPELAARRALILTHLDAYIAKGTTPVNRDLPWRNPVFVDHLGNACAVGALIEATHPEGRALVERIAARHRHDYLEDIDMAEVRAWIDGSGFTRDELASIQPGYLGPPVNNYESAWDRDAPPPDGPWSRGGVAGEMRAGHMHGTWTMTDEEGRTRGRGEFVRGRGRWTSFHPDGSPLARGPYVGSVPSGTWTFWHASGRVAARGAFRRGDRHGTWTLYRDSPSHPVLARGAFVEGEPRGRWRHFDERGGLVATVTAIPRELDIAWRLVTPRVAGVELRVDQGTFLAEHARLDRLVGHFGGEPITVYRLPEHAVDDAAEAVGGDPDAPGADSTEALQLYTADGRPLTRTQTGWSQSECPWNEDALRAARAGRPELVARAVASDAGLDACAMTALSPEAGRALDALLGTADDPRPWHELVTRMIDTSQWFAEWDHVDALFVAVYDTLPDRVGTSMD